MPTENYTGPFYDPAKRTGMAVRRTGDALSNALRNNSTWMNNAAKMARPSAQTLLRGYVPIAALGQAAYDWTQYRGNQMDNDPAVKQRMATMRDYISRGYIPTDEEGVWTSPKGNRVLESDIPTITQETIIPFVWDNPLSSTSFLSGLIPSGIEPEVTSSNASETVETNVPDTTVQKATAKTGDATIQGTSTPKRSRGTAKKKATTTATKVNVPSSEEILNSVNTSNSGSNGLNINFLSHINDLLPLLAAGGLGYLLAK